MKTGQIHHLDSREDSGLKIIKFWKIFFIEVISKDAIFPNNLTSLNLKL